MTPESLTTSFAGLKCREESGELKRCRSKNGSEQSLDLFFLWSSASQSPIAAARRGESPSGLVMLLTHAWSKRWTIA